MAVKARIWWDSSCDAYVVSTSYNDKFVNTMKQFIPSGGRSYDPQTKFWFITEPYGEMIRQTAEACFGKGSVSFTSKTVASQSQQSYQSAKVGANAVLNPNKGTVEDAVVAFCTLLPYDAAKRAYLVAAQSLHPDKQSGDATKMTRLNELWTRLEKEFFKKEVVV